MTTAIATWLLRTTRRTLIPALTVSALLASGAGQAQAAQSCAPRMIQGSIEDIDTQSTVNSGPYVPARTRLRVTTRCKNGRPGVVYTTRVCVRHPGDVVRCRTVRTRGAAFGGGFIVTTTSVVWRYRVSWAPRAGAPIALRDYRITYTGFEPPN